MEGEGTFPVNSLQPSATIVFQGIGYATVQYSLQELKRHPAFTMQELQYNLQEATATGISPKEILKKAIEKLQKIKVAKSNPYLESIDGILYDKQQKRLLLYPRGRISTTYRVPKGTKSMSDSAFRLCNRLQTVIISDK